MATSPSNAADYRSEPVVGRRWRRACRVVINNPYGGPATVAFDEEQVTEIEGERKASPTATLSCAVDPTAEIPLLNPDTGEPLPFVATHAEVYTILYSLYRQLAKQRDEA